MEPRLIEVQQRRRPQVEQLEERIAPARSVVGGVLSMTPPGAVEGNSWDHLHPVPGLGGLDSAEARSGVINWTPT